MPRPRSSLPLALLCLAAAGIWLLSGQFGADGRPEKTAPAATSAPEPRAVRVVRSKAEPRQDVVRVTGHTEASRKVELRVEIDARVVELPVARGQTAREGDVVVRLATDDRQARVQEAQALLRQRQIEYDAVRQLHTRGHRPETAVAEAAALLDAAKAAVKRAEVELANTVLRAPFDGVVEQRPVELGSYLRAGDLAATILDLDPVRVVGHVVERDVTRMRAAMKGTAVLSNGVAIDGAVTFVSAVADPQTRTFGVELEAPNPENRVVEGLTAELRLPVGEIVAHEISASVLTLDDDGRVGVKTVAEDGTVAFAPVKVLGNERAGRVLVAGLPAQATIVSVGQEYVAAGEKVRAVPAEAAPTGRAE